MMPDFSLSDHSNPSNDNPQIDQAVKGDHNQVIGQAIDSTIVNFAGEGQVISLTIHERIPEASAPPPISEMKPLTQQEYRQRKVLLNKVREYWVKGVLETSLNAKALIELGLQERLDLVQRPFSGVAEFSDAPGRALPEGSQATTVFEHMGEGRTLLILGEPGAGKTIALLKLTQDLIARTELDLRQPIPVVFNLSSWARKSQTIEQWLVQELLEKYQVSKALGKAWVETESLILLLDGLDEVKAEQRNACVQALNQFMQTHGTTEITICCRIRDYQVLTERLTLRSAICIQPLTPEQINSYFEQAGEQLSALKTVLQHDGELQDLATSPLMLSIMSLAYQGCTPEQVSLRGRTEGYRKRILENYIDRMFQRRGTTQQYPQEETQRWLIWLAQRIIAGAQTMFLIERMQPSWLPNRGQRISYRIESAFIGSLFFGLMSALIFGAFFTLLFKTGNHISELILWLSISCSVGITVGFLGEIKPVETLNWSWKALQNNLRLALVGTIMGLATGGVIYGLIFGLTSFMLSELIFGLFYGFGGSEIHQKDNPNQGIWQSFQNATILGIIIGLILWLITGLLSLLAGGTIFGAFIGCLLFGLIFGLIGWLSGGGAACIRHIVLRFKFYRLGYSPWNYARFLDYATERLFLQKVGGGYIFVHRMLLEHFAGMSPEQEQR